ncbi:MAG: DUF2185 domain-containing protein [Oscillospiraceae bacterium]|nr:DUF2185 domain-containing protein [Oscillospiraceae bacterium]
MIIEDVFKQNLKFISQTKLDTEKTRRQYTKTDTRDFVTIGKVDLPSGRIRIGDPFVYMCEGKLSPELDRTVAPGTYPVEIAVSKTPVAGMRICCARIRFSSNSAASYTLAEPTHETAVSICKDGDMTGFPVDAGMLAFMDTNVLPQYISYFEKCRTDNTEFNIYDDYFAQKFEESYKKMPEYQRAGGDFLEWAIPETNHRAVMLSTGFGDGFYQCYWGLDMNGEICELTVPLIDSDIVDKANKEFLDIWDGPEYCIVTKHIADGGKITYMVHDEPSGRPGDSGWQFFGENENDEYWSNAKNYVLYSVHRLADRYPAIIALLRSPDGTAFFCDKNGNFVPDEG